MSETEDLEATHFAMHLLMPEKFLRAEIKRLKVKDLSDERAVGDLAKKFQVSPAIMGYRLGMLVGK